MRIEDTTRLLDCTLYLRESVYHAAALLQASYFRRRRRSMVGCSSVTQACELESTTKSQALCLPLLDIRP